MRCLADLFDLLNSRAVTGALAGGNHSVRVEEGEIARQLLDGAVSGNGMRAVLDVAVCEKP